MVPSKREATKTLAIGLQKGSTFVDSTFGIDNTNIMSVGAKHLDISNNSYEVKTGTSIEVESGCIEVDGGVDGSSSAVPCSTIVGGTTISAATDIVGVRGTESLDTLEISIRYGRSSRVVPTNTIVGGGTGSAATDIVGVRGTRSYDIRDTSLETAVGGDASDAALGGGSDVTTRDNRYYRDRVSLASIRHFPSFGII